MPALAVVDNWPVRTAAVAVVRGDGAVLDSCGPLDAVLPLASVTKLLTSYAVLLAVEEGALDLDDPAGPPGATLRHLLAHASGLAPSGDAVLAAPGTRRIYSNTGIEVAAAAVAEATGIGFADYLTEGVLTPLGMRSTTLTGSPASAAASSVTDLLAFVGELCRPRLLAPATVRAATTVAFPGLSGVLPGFGRQDRNDWGLGFEIRDGKRPHWTAPSGSPATYGHFGQSGTFLWVDPDADLACVCLTDHDFGDWAVRAWPALAEAVLAERRA